MISCASPSTPFTRVAASHRNSFLPGDSPIPFPRHAPPTLRLPPHRISVGVRAAYSSAAAKMESEYTARDSAGGYYYSSYSQTIPTFAAPTAAPSLYNVLGISAGATAAEIKTAYRRLARSCHPDASKGNGGSAPAEQFMLVHAAYATLSDPDKRAEYDRRLAVSVSNGGGRIAGRMYWRAASYSGPAGSMGRSSFGGRTWETEQCW